MKINILVLLLAIFGCDLINAMHSEERGHKSKSKLLKKLDASIHANRQAYVRAIDETESNQTPGYEGLLTFSRLVNSLMLLTLRENLMACDEKMWARREGKMFDCNDLLGEYEGLLNFPVDDENKAFYNRF